MPTLEEPIYLLDILETKGDSLTVFYGISGRDTRAGQDG